MNHEFMKTRSIFPLVLAMSVPNILSMLINSLYNIVDSYFVARISEDAMTAISIVFPIQNFSLAIAVGFSIGMNALIAQLMGRGELEQAGRAGSSGLALCALHGLVVLLGCRAILPGFLGMYTNDPALLAMGLQYGTIVLLFSVPLHLYIGIEKIYQALGKMQISMICMIFGCVVNIILDPLLIFGMGPFPAMGIAGAAWATGISQALVLVLYFLIYISKPLPLQLSFRQAKPVGNLCARLYGVGVPASLNIGLPSLLISSLNGILAGFGQIYLVILGIYYKLQTFVYMPASGLIQGIRPLVGYNFGAGEFDRVKKIYRVALSLASAMMLAGMVICFVFPTQLMSLFSTNPETIREGAKALRIISLGFIPSAVSITGCGSLEGLGLGVQSLMISLLRYTVLIIPLAWVFSLLSHSAAGVWHAFWVTELFTGILAFFLYRRTFHKRVGRVQAGRK